MARGAMFLLAFLVLLGGVALALFVVPTRTCGMDAFDCFGSRNAPKFLAGLGAALAALAVAVIAAFLPKGPTQRSNGT